MRGVRLRFGAYAIIWLLMYEAKTSEERLYSVTLFLSRRHASAKQSSNLFIFRTIIYEIVEFGENLRLISICPWVELL
jgi:hypothetical protein